MACAANYAWANRQMIMHLTEQALLHALRMAPKDLGLRLVYDVAHNIAKLETHEVDGAAANTCVHRKGATRAFGPGRPEVPDGLPRGRAAGAHPRRHGPASFVCRAPRKPCGDLRFHLPRRGQGDEPLAALKRAQGRAIDRELQAAGIVVRSQGRKTLAEEMPEAYKDVERVVGVMDARRHLTPGGAAATPGGRQGLSGRARGTGESAARPRAGGRSRRGRRNDF